MKTLFNIKSADSLGAAENLALNSFLADFPAGVPFHSVLDLAVRADATVSVHSHFVGVPRVELAASIRATRDAVDAKVNAMMQLYSAAKAWVDFIDADALADDDPREVRLMLQDLQVACKGMAPLV